MKENMFLCRKFRLIQKMKKFYDNSGVSNSVNQEEKNHDNGYVREDRPKAPKKTWVWLCVGLVSAVIAIITIITIVSTVIPLYRNMLISDAGKILSDDNELVDKAKAVSLYERAAFLGDVESLIKLGKLYCTQIDGIERDYNKAFDLFCKAAEKGYDEANEELINIRFKIEEDRFYGYIKDQAEKMDPYALHMLGLYWRNHLDFELADDYFKKAFKGFFEQKEKSKWVLYRIGCCYSEGYGVPEDESEGVKWYRIAAEQGNTCAQSTMGWCYRFGKGVPIDGSEVIKWYRMAAENGDMYAQSNLADFYYTGEYLPSRDHYEAIKWLRLSANQGDAASMIFLGKIFENGYEIPVNESEAEKWYRKAAERGVEYAIKWLESHGK